MAMGGSLMSLPSASKVKIQVSLFSSFTSLPTRFQMKVPSRRRVTLGSFGATASSGGMAVALAAGAGLMGVAAGFEWSRFSRTFSAVGSVAGAGAETVGAAAVAGADAGAVAVDGGGSIVICASETSTGETRSVRPRRDVISAGLVMSDPLSVGNSSVASGQLSVAEDSVTGEHDESMGLRCSRHAFGTIVVESIEIFF